MKFEEEERLTRGTTDYLFENVFWHNVQNTDRHKNLKVGTKDMPITFKMPRLVLRRILLQVGSVNDEFMLGSTIARMLPVQRHTVSQLAQLAASFLVGLGRCLHGGVPLDLLFDLAASKMATYGAAHWAQIPLVKPKTEVFWVLGETEANQ